MQGKLSWGDFETVCSVLQTHGPAQAHLDPAWNTSVHHGDRNVTATFPFPGNYTIRLQAERKGVVRFQDVSVIARTSLQDGSDPARASAGSVPTFPYQTQWNDSKEGTATDAWWVRMGGRAGALGRIFPNATDGGRYYQGGRRVRLWGANLCFGANLPPQPLAASIAGRISKLGFNAIRLMSFDENGLGPDGRHFSASNVPGEGINATTLDRLDKLAAELAARGVYLRVGLHVNRYFGNVTWPQDKPGRTKYDKGTGQVVPAYRESYRSWVQQLLQHRNPYTGMRWADDPAVVSVELSNEDSLVTLWLRGGLDLPASNRTMGYGELLGQLFNTWLDNGTVYGQASPLTLPCEPSTVPAKDRGSYINRIGWTTAVPSSNTRACWLAFLFAAERSYFETMARFVKDDIGFGGIVVGTQVHTDALTSQFLSPSVDAIDVHNYFANIKNELIHNVPQSGLTSGGALSTIAPYRAVGMPLTVTEFNQPNPSQFGGEVAPLLASYARAQDLDGAYLFTLAATHYVHGFGDETQLFPEHGWQPGRVVEYYRTTDASHKTVPMVAASRIALLGDGVGVFPDGGSGSDSEVSPGPRYLRITPAGFDGWILNRTNDPSQSDWKGAMPCAADLGLPANVSIERRVGIDFGARPLRASTSGRGRDPADATSRGSTVSSKAAAVSGSNVAQPVVGSSAPWVWAEGGGQGYALVRGQGVKAASGFINRQRWEADPDRRPYVSTDGFVDLGDDVLVRVGGASAGGRDRTGLMNLDTERGDIRSGDGLANTTALGWAVVTLTGVGNSSSSSAPRALLTACGTWTNTGMERLWTNPERTFVNSTSIALWGTSPARLEGVLLEARLPCSSPAAWGGAPTVVAGGESFVSVFALGPSGERLGGAVVTAACSGPDAGVSILLDGRRELTVQYEVLYGG